MPYNHFLDNLQLHFGHVHLTVSLVYGHMGLCLFAGLEGVLFKHRLYSRFALGEAAPSCYLVFLVLFDAFALFFGLASDDEWLLVLPVVFFVYLEGALNLVAHLALRFFVVLLIFEVAAGSQIGWQLEAEVDLVVTLWQRGELKESFALFKDHMVVFELCLYLFNCAVVILLCFISLVGNFFTSLYLDFHLTLRQVVAVSNKNLACYVFACRIESLICSKIEEAAILFGFFV